MKRIKAIVVTLGLASVFVIMSACIDVHSEKSRKDLPPTGNGKGFAVVELFTSEGCSSCPPADELIANIQRNNPDKQIYIMAFHVDYWDRQGWKDTFSDPEFSNRQRQYASWLHLETVYTPQIVINGTSEYVGSDRAPIVQAISEGLEQDSTNALLLHCTIAGDQLKVDYQQAGNEKKSELVLALVQKAAQSQVSAGENKGRNLSHVQIVRQLQRVDINSKKEIAIDLPHDFNEKDWELIGFVQHKTDGHIVAADRYDFQTRLALQK